MKLLLDDGDGHVGGDGTPDLSLDRVLAGAEEALDAQMLLDPLEEQFDLPATLVERADGERWQGGVVGQEDQRFARLRVFEANAPQMLWIGLGRIEASEHDPLVADHASIALRGCRIDAPGIHPPLGASDKESPQPDASCTAA